MGVPVSLQSFVVDVRSLEKDLLELGNKAPLVMARSLNRAGLAGQTAMVKVIGQDTGIAAKNIKREIKLDRANRSTPRITFTINASRIPLIAFSARGPEPTRGRGRGVSYRLPTGRGRLEGGFIATMPSGHRGVFVRKVKPGRRSAGAWSDNLPIKEKFGPSVAHVFEKYIDVFRSTSEEALIANLRHEIDFENRPVGEFPVGLAE